MIPLATLRALPSLKSHPDAELELLASVSTERTLKQGEVLCREGEIGKSCFLLVSGALEIRRRFASGERRIATMAAGTFVGQLALVDHAPRSATVCAVSESVLLEFSRDTFDRLLHACTPMALRFQSDIAIAGIRQLRLATRRLAGVLDARDNTPSGAHADDDALSFIQAAATEWGLSLEELDAIEAVRTEGSRRKR